MAKKKPKPKPLPTTTPPTKEEIIAALQDAMDAFDQATDDYIDAVANGTQAQIQAALLALVIALRNLKRAETDAFVYALSTLP